jgi:hypothetical protein
MTPFTAACLTLGAGLIAFWTWGLSGGLTRGEEPWPGFRDHELSFAVPDLTIAAALLAAAAADPPAARALATAAAGALVFLGLLDAAYLARTWALRLPAMRARTAAVCVATWAGAAALLALAP